MSKVSEMVTALQEAAYEMGDAYGFETATLEQLAEQFKVPVAFVEEALEDNVFAEDDYDDSMDGDFDSGMASAGFGMDEDYVCDNDYFDDY